MSQQQTSHLDPYTEKAERTDISLQEKINGLHQVVNKVKTGMLTSRSSGGHLHSRAMSPASPIGENQLTLVFLANKVTHKCEELENDANVNVSFYDQHSTNWASYSGKARVSQDRELIKKHWSTFVSAWFGDLKDGVHKGDENDPRVIAIEVIPEEIRYWIVTKGYIGRSVDIGVSAMTGGTASPGEIRTITKDEIELTRALHTK
ncbi:hypothetical protein AX17_005819 [Amanita inopinata Kibby_2008]|nr:hypothetical protein AX17_005819 [Amanita inopinata Kibby_2008]